MGYNKNYVKMMTRNLSVNYPDYALILVDAFECSKSDEIKKEILNDFRVAFALDVCVVIILTKVDAIEDPQKIQKLMYALRT